MNWQQTQQHEKEYAQNVESQTWHIPYGYPYWSNLLKITGFSGAGLEIGCGTHGVYNFTSNIVGVDSINFRRHNFIQASAEHLPIKKVDYAILCNSLDHCENPAQVLNEATHVANRLVLWTYTYPCVVSFFLQKFDKLHPHHFTNTKLTQLIKNFNVISHVTYSPTIFNKYTPKRSMKIKLTLMKLLSIKCNLLHMEVPKNG